MQPTAQPTLQLKVFRTLWGVTTPWQQTLSELKSVGCCGIEARVPLSADERQTLARRLQESELEYIAILFSGGGVIPAQAETPHQHLERLKSRFAEAKELNPRFVNLLAGNDRHAGAAGGFSRPGPRAGRRLRGDLQLRNPSRHLAV